MKKRVSIVIVCMLCFITSITAYAAKSENELTIIEKEEKKEYKNNAGEVRLYLNYQYPMLEGPQKGISIINKETEKQKQVWFDSHKEILDYIKDEVGYNYKNGDEVSYVITYNKNGLLCVLYEGYLYTGGAHGTPYRNAYTYDLSNGKVLGPCDILHESKKQIKEKIVAEFKKKVQENKDWYWPEALQIVKDTEFSKIAYYVTDEGVVFYFDPYVLAPYAGGFIEVIVPFKSTN